MARLSHWCNVTYDENDSGTCVHYNQSNILFLRKATRFRVGTLILTTRWFLCRDTTQQSASRHWTGGMTCTARSVAMSLTSEMYTTTTSAIDHDVLPWVLVQDLSIHSSDQKNVNQVLMTIWYEKEKFVNSSLNTMGRKRYLPSIAHMFPTLISVLY